MNISKAIKLSIAGVAVVALPGLASAMPGLDADGNNNMTAAGTLGTWSATQGTAGLDITAGALPAGMTAGGAPIADDGFLQRQITDTTTGATYIQTIIAETTGAIGAGFNFGTAADAFADESWVRMESVMGGLLGKSAIQENGTAETFSVSATFATGGFQGTSTDLSADKVTLNQTVADIANDSNGTMNSQFVFNHGLNVTAAGDANGVYANVQLDQTVGGNDLKPFNQAGVISQLNTLTATFQMQNNALEGTIIDQAQADLLTGLRLNIGVDIDSGGSTTAFRIGERAGGAAITGVDGGTWDITTSGFEQGASSLAYAAGDQIVQIYLNANIAGAGTFAKSSFSVEAGSTATAGTSTFVLSFDDAAGPFGQANETNLTADPFIF